MIHNNCRRKHKWARQVPKKLLGIILLAMVLLILTGSGFAYGGNAKYIILMIGDGWGPKHVEAVNKYTGATPLYQSGSPWVKYMVSTFPEGGSYDTTQAWSNFNYVNTNPNTQDSACTASAIYSGFKTSIGRMSVSSDASTRLFTIGERAKELGKAVGAISTVPASHATPGAWVAHNDTRVNTFAIADEGFFGDPNTTGTVATDPKYGGGHGPTIPPADVLIGGGVTNYISNQILSKLRTENGQAGKHVLVERQTGVDGGDALMSAANNSTSLKLAGLFDQVYHNADDSGYSSENPTLSESVLAAVKVLSRNPNGFVLMAEGGAIDWGSHSNNMNQMVGEGKDFDNAVQTVTNWVDDPTNDATWSNTLVIVTADHECGYLTAGPGVLANQPLGNVNSVTLSKEKIVSGSGGRRASWEDTNNNSIIDAGETVYWYWNSGNHSNSLVPLYARGTGSELFVNYAINNDSVRGLYLDNTNVFSVMNSSVISETHVFTAYNDLSWSTGQVNTNITLYTTGQNGRLKDYLTGTNTTVTLTIAGGYNIPIPDQGSNANSGADAYTVFNGIVDSVGLISYSATNLTFTFTGLDPNLNYEFVLFGNRNNASYTNRMTTTTISDVTSFTNSSTPGATFSGATDPAVTIVNGYNTVNGYVARFTNINPGADGDMLITVSSPTGYFYANALMLRATQEAGNSPPMVSATSPVNNATNVAVNSAINATFSEAMNAATIGTFTFTVSNGSTSANIVGAVSYSGTSTTATFTSSGNLSYSTLYTATITTGVKDAVGNAMAANYIWSFTTGAGGSPGGQQAYYRFDEGSGTTAADSSGSGNNGALINGPVWTTGKINNALSFDGVNDYVKTADTPFDFERTNSFSASAWIKLAPTTGENAILDKEGAAPSYTGWSFYVEPGSLRVFIVNKWDSPYNRLVRDSAIQVDDNVWHHVAFTYNGTSLGSGINIYIDGNLSNGTVVYDNLSGSILNDVPLGIGMFPGSAIAFKGLIDEVRVYNRALSDQEVQSLYTNGTN